MAEPRFIEFSKNIYFPKMGKALDLGCFEGRESQELLNRGFEVDAIDSKVIPEIKDPNFHFKKIDLQIYNIAPNTYDLILAYYVLPFLKEEKLIEKTINHIRNGLKDHGVAIITLFGDEHEWRGRGHHYFSNKEVAERLIGKYIDVHEEKGTRKAMQGGKAFWHSWDFVIQK